MSKHLILIICCLATFNSLGQDDTRLNKTQRFSVSIYAEIAMNLGDVEDSITSYPQEVFVFSPFNRKEMLQEILGKPNQQELNFYWEDKETAFDSLIQSKQEGLFIKIKIIGLDFLSDEEADYIDLTYSKVLIVKTKSQIVWEFKETKTSRENSHCLSKNFTYYN